MGLYDMFSGGNLSNATIFALGIMPYISASIILQLLQAVVPYFEKLAKEGEEGRKKITQYTRYGTVLLAMIHWGDRYEPNPKGDRVVFVEKATGEPIAPMGVRSHDGRTLGPGDIKAVPGPGLQRSRKRRSSKTKQ